jgi:hypothetical protein
MKTKDIIVEGPIDFISKKINNLDFVKKAKGAYTGAQQGYQQTKDQQAERDRNKQATDRVYKAWQQELVKFPNISPDQLSKLLVTWSDNRFHDRPGTNVTPPPQIGPTDEKVIYNYLLSRIQEYFLDITTQTPSTGAASAGVAAGASTAGASGASAPAASYSEPVGLPGAPSRYIKGPEGWVDAKNKSIHAPANLIKMLDQVLSQTTPRTNQTAKPAPTATTPATATGPVDFTRGEDGKLRMVQESGRMIRVLSEGGNAIARSTPVKKEDVATVVNQAKSLLPEQLLRNLQTDIGSAGYKVQSGDIDVMVEATDTVEVFQTQSSKDPVKEAKQKLKLYFEGKGVEAVVNGRNVSIGINYQEQSTDTSKIAQVDVMVIHEAAIVASWHQHGPRGQYSDSDFKGSELFMLISSIAKFLGLKFDAFGANLMRRDNNEVVGRTRKEVAKILLNPKAKENDLDSVKSIVKALEADPDREGKLAQARQDAAKGLMNLPETAVPGTAVWFRQMTNVLQ